LGNRYDALFLPYLALENPKPKKSKRKLKKKKTDKNASSPTSDNLYNTVNRRSGRRSSNKRYSSKRLDESLDPGFRETQSARKDALGAWEMWWKQKEENEGKLKDYITKQDFEGTSTHF
jgi:hypothetical protein